MQVIGIEELGLFVELENSTINIVGTEHFGLEFQNEILAGIWFQTLLDLVETLPEFTL
ncbi:hypothetical protein [Latilactobacillus phage TMW 1.706 P1]|uniref:hypothetical protein n=1 Tax=Latilactobacillus curvatus TaxID=28038 RepID=UPI000AAC02C1|nr:hypothetical protein [Latilactobacillus curvatus]MDG2988412.1 hypothetical protein [Latilactobacillus curvatus]WCZ54874.1 hypothetical protein [Latilactobacillus phage TMW 1.706 P1]GED82638.1 hypothetical protein LCU01_15460 [Latilactobacillus curvatus]